jgi:exonuclease VII large subunit
MLINQKITVAFFCLIAALPLSADRLSNLAKSLIELRSDVEKLHSQLDDTKQSYTNSIKSLNVQRTDIEAAISRESLKIKQLKSALKKVQDRIALQSGGSKAYKKVAQDAIELLKTELSKQLPFKMKDRVKELETISRRIAHNQITPEKGLNRVWAIYEDNFRMSHENGVFRQNVTINGQEYLADVVRLGSVAMYFKTSDDKMGYFTKTSTGWTLVQTVDSEDKALIAYLFDSMKKQIRSGFFTIPNTFSKAQ